MAKIPMRSILTIFWAFATCCNCQSIDPGVSSSWAKLQISPDALSSMEYGNFLIDIYEHAHNHKATTTSEKKYFYSPIALLDNKSAVSSYNNVTKQPEMRFRIEMWNDKVQYEVVKYLNDIVGHEIKSHNVRVIPLEKVILTSLTSNIPTADYSLSPVWTNYDRSKTLKLSLLCYDQNVCDRLANEMRSNPEQFDHLKMLYSLSSQKSQTKITTITIESVNSGQMITNLLQKFRNKKEIFLTANDEKKMLAEMATNIRMDTFDDYEVGSPDTESQILNILKNMLVTSRTTIKEQCDKMWDSVFWDEENYRPDKTTQMLNEIVNKMDKETQKKLVDMFQAAVKNSEIMEILTSRNQDMEFEQDNEEMELPSWDEYEYDRNLEIEEKIQHDYDPNSWADVDKISSKIAGKMAIDSGSSRSIDILKEEVKRLLQESRDHVQWDGEKFVPKPMQLSRINLCKLRDSQSFQDRTVRFRYTNAELSMPIKFMEQVESIVTDEWNNLKEELTGVRELLEKTKTELTNTRTDLASKLEGSIVKTNKEIKLNASFRKTIDDLSKKLIATEKELAEMKISVENLSSELKGSKQELAKIKTKIELEKKENKEELAKTRADFSKSVSELSTDLNVNSQSFRQELKVANDNLRKELKEELRETSRKLETTIQNVAASARTAWKKTDSAVAILTKKLNARTRIIVDIGEMPTSCEDLQRMGHKLSGFFLVKGSMKMEAVYCNFYPNGKDLQKKIGYADVKSTPVYFYVQRKAHYETRWFTSTGTPITYELTQVNEGNAMDLSSGKFTAPRQGIYFFSFTALSRLPSSSKLIHFSISLYLNGRSIGLAFAEEYYTLDGQNEQVTIQSTLKLAKGDKVWAQISSMSQGVKLTDYDGQYTHFTGFMLEEEIVASF
ncbi:uncharacterized protein LOC124336071 isoform X2 [Daphnia pulicaria]|uniref:uncharacterized protein LOC124336071 isoform X2 n=1 Tax=Daphnia pulicaria TaxID=35523 RepID=UPI001EEA2DA3|nr:uncharacterized protein LOC124336071 isoform X2 [Daphnia pulicaria]